MKRFIICVAAISAMASATFASETIIGQKDRQFSKDVVALKKGDMLHFINDDSVTHNISIKDAGGQGKPGILQKPGEQTEIAFDQIGDYSVMCLIHPKMKMAVKVQ